MHPLRVAELQTATQPGAQESHILTRKGCKAGHAVRPTHVGAPTPLAGGRRCHNLGAQR